MLTSGLFKIHEVVVEAKVGDTFKLIPFGDVHRDSPSFAHEEWKEFLERASGVDNKRSLFLGMGDYVDVASTSERTVIRDERLHDGTKKVLEDHAKGVLATIARELDFMKGRLIGLIGGNHYFAFEGGVDSDQRLAIALNTRYLGVCSLIRLTFRITGSTDKAVSLDIMAHHGRGGGSLAGSSFNTVEKMQNVMDADIYLMGHDHSRGVLPAKPRLRLTHGSGGLSVKERQPLLGRTGSFLKAYEPGMVNYNVDVCRSPVSLGWIEFDLTIERDRSAGSDELKVKVRSTT